MDQLSCFVCKESTLDKLKYNIETTYTTGSKVSLKNLLETTVNNKICNSAQLEVCHDCCCLLIDLDDTAQKYKSICDKLCSWLGYTGNSKELKETEVPTTCNEESSVQPEPKSATKYHKCADCSKTFSSRKGLRMHIQRLHQKPSTDAQTQNDIPIIADVENTNITSEIGQQHIENNTIDNVIKENGNANVETGMEDEETVQKSKKKPGRKKKHPDTPKPHQCNQCPKAWRTVSELKNHLISHSQERPFICEICGQAYKHKTALNIHVGMHNGISPFTCVYCKKCFTQKGGLLRHMPIHTGELPYQCDLCGKCFVHHTSFKIHQLSHTGQKHYKCNICSLALLSASHLKRHLRVHTGEKNFVCTTCGKRFAEKYNLISHQKLHETQNSNRNISMNKKYRLEKLI